jgi:signal transduction histidine kinase
MRTAGLPVDEKPLMMFGTYTINPNFWLSVCTVILLLALSFYSVSKRKMPGALPFAIGSLLAGLWVAGSVFRYAAVDAEIKIFWYRFESLWQLSAITATTCFILDYAWPGRWLTRRNLILLSIVPLLDFLLILTNNLHHLVWRTYTYDGFLIPRQGFVGWFAFAYAFALSILNIIVLVWLFWRSPQHRWPVIIILTGQVFARTMYLAGVTDLVHTDLPLDTLGIGFVFLMYAIVLFAFHIFDPIPLAHQTAIEQLKSGMLVLDTEQRVVSLNPMAEKILNMSARQAKGHLITDLLPSYPAGQLDDPGEVEIEFSSGVGQEYRSYTLSISRLKDFRQLEIGRLLMLRDVTEQKQAQAQILEKQRALAMLQERERLARELHDSLGQVFAFVNTQGQAASRLLGHGDIPTAQAHLNRLVEVSREADMDIRESILGLRADLSELGFFPALVQYLTRYERTFGIHTQLTKPESFRKVVFEPVVEVQLLRILQEALTNVRKHASACSVQISFKDEGGWVCVTVKDDGQGFDLQAGSVLAEEHVGFGVMRERAEEVGGSLHLNSTPGQGTEVVVLLPVIGDAADGDPTAEGYVDV